MISFFLFSNTTWIFILSSIALLFVPSIQLFVEAQVFTTLNISAIQEVTPYNYTATPSNTISYIINPINSTDSNSNYTATPSNTISYIINPINSTDSNSNNREITTPLSTSSQSFTVTNLTITMFQDTLVGKMNNEITKSITNSLQKIIFGSIKKEGANPTISITPRNSTILTAIGY